MKVLVTAGWRFASQRRGLAWWVALGAVALAACVAAAFVAMLSSVASLQGAATAQQVADRELTVAGRVGDDVLVMETALRDFLLAPESRSLAPYYAAQTAFARDTRMLLAVEHSDDGAEDPATKSISREMLSYQQRYARPVIQLATKRRLSRREVTRQTAAGSLRLRVIRTQLTRQTAISAGDARQRQSRAQAAAAATRQFAISGLIALVCLIAFFALTLHRGIARPLGRLRGAAEWLARGDRDGRMPRSRVRELDDLGRSFDVMADALTAGREALQTQNHTLDDRVRERTHELEAARVEILNRLARAAEFRDDATHEHTERVARTAQLLGQTLKLSVEQTELLGLAAPLHDIGKIGIPDAVLLKAGRLTDAEFAIMRTHARLGAGMLDGSDSPILQMAAQIALHHHERWDGTGYPEQLRAEQIPLVARIVAVADVLDALTHERPYKPAWSLQHALHEMTSQSGRQFDPLVIDALHQLDHGQLLPAGTAIHAVGRSSRASASTEHAAARRPTTSQR
jgi:HD-GYP domain-containing protein (c-di-GMP phosphodiesterase class II)/CHASE3 domain sensor protein